MCEHDDFDILYYKQGVMIRQCKQCKQIEINFDWSWIPLYSLKEAVTWLIKNNKLVV